MERVRGKGEALIDYRHVHRFACAQARIVRARYHFREQMYVPTHTFRLAYDAMWGWKGERADVTM